MMDDETENAILDDLANMGDSETKVPETPAVPTVEQVANDIITQLMQAFMTHAMVSTRAAVRQGHSVHQLIQLPCSENPDCPNNKLFVERFTNEKAGMFHFAYWDGRFSNSNYATRESEDFCMLVNLMREFIPPEKYHDMGLEKEEDLLEIFQGIMKEKASHFEMTIGSRMRESNPFLLIIMVNAEEIVTLYLPPLRTMTKCIPISLPFVQANPTELGGYFPIERARYFRWPKK